MPTYRYTGSDTGTDTGGNHGNQTAPEWVEILHEINTRWCVVQRGAHKMHTCYEWLYPTANTVAGAHVDATPGFNLWH